MVFIKYTRMSSFDCVQSTLVTFMTESKEKEAKRKKTLTPNVKQSQMECKKSDQSLVGFNF